jgi:hypothetical protein
MAVVRGTIEIQGDWLPSAKRMIQAMRQAHVAYARLVTRLLRVDEKSPEHALAVEILDMVHEAGPPFHLMDRERCDLLADHKNDKEGCAELEWFLKATRTEMNKETDEVFEKCFEECFEAPDRDRQDDEDDEDDE